VGLVTSCIWAIGGVALRNNVGLDRTYFAIAIGLFIAQLNLVPVALVISLREARGRVKDEDLRAARRYVAYNVACVGMLDLVAVVYVALPDAIAGPVSVIWLAIWSTAAGVFAGSAARRAPDAFRERDDSPTYHSAPRDAHADRLEPGGAAGRPGDRS
jgi:hypothetical protein